MRRRHSRISDCSSSRCATSPPRRNTAASYARLESCGSRNPRFSRQIHSLERTVGTPLFERDRRGVRLTPAGTALLSGAQALFAKLEHAVRRTQHAHDGKLGTRKLGLGRVAVESRKIGRAIAEIGERFPEIRLAVSEVASFSQPQALRAGELDIAIGLERSGEDSSMRHEVLYADAVDRALIPATHPLASAAVIEPEQLRGERLMMLRAAAVPGYSELYEALRRLGFVQWEEYDWPDTVYGLVAAGRGWTTHVGSMEKTPPGTVAVPLKGLRVPVSIVVRWNDSDTSRLTSNVVAVLRASSDESSSRGGSTKRRDTPRSVERQIAKVPTDLELRHMRSFVVTVEEGSLSHAAPRLGLTQSGLSRQIRTLERAFGFRLLSRVANGIAPTAAGEVFRSDAAEILALADDVLARTQRVDRGISGACRIGAIPSQLTGDILTGVLGHLREQFPAIAVEVREVLTPRQIDALREGEIDVGLAGAYPGLVDDPSIASVQLSDDSVDCALLASTHPLASRAWLTPADLATEPFLFIARPTYPKLYDTVMQAFADIGLRPVVNGVFDSPRTVWRLAADSMGWTVGTRSLRSNPVPGLVAVPIEGFHVPSGVALLWRRDETDPSIRVVLDAFRGSGNGKGNGTAERASTN